MEKYIGFALRASKCVLGVDNILSCKSKIYVIIEDETLSQNSLSKIHNFAENKNINEITTVNLEQIVHIPNVKCVAITEKSLAQQIIKQREV